MDTFLRGHRKSVTRILIVGMALVIAGCTFRPAILSATSTRIEQEEMLTVSLRPEDAETIKRRQMYFSVVLFDCEGTRDGYPARPFIGGVRASSFRFPVDEERVRVTARVPDRVYDGYSRPCVFLRGGSYFMGEIESESAHVTPSGSGPN